MKIKHLNVNFLFSFSLIVVDIKKHHISYQEGCLACRNGSTMDRMPMRCSADFRNRLLVSYDKWYDNRSNFNCIFIIAISLNYIINLYSIFSIWTHYLHIFLFQFPVPKILLNIFEFRDSKIKLKQNHFLPSNRILIQLM